MVHGVGVLSPDGEEVSKAGELLLEALDVSGVLEEEDLEMILVSGSICGEIISYSAESGLEAV